MSKQCGDTGLCTLIVYKLHSCSAIYWLVQCIRTYMCSYAPINVMPHLPQVGPNRGPVRELVSRFFPRGGDFVPPPYFVKIPPGMQLCVVKYTCTLKSLTFPRFSSNNDAVLCVFHRFGTKSIIFVHISIFYTKLPTDPLLYTRGNVGILNQWVAPRVSTLLINWCKTPIFPHPGPTWGSWGMSLIGVLSPWWYSTVLCTNTVDSGY